MISSKIDQLIQEFAVDLRAAIAEEAAAAFAQIAGGRSASFAPAAKRGRKPTAVAAASSKDGGRVRRSSEDLEKQSSLILAYIKKNPGQRAEQIGAALSLASREMMLPIAKLLEEKKLSKKGVKRATAYSAR
jgi:hypothetical protein